MTNVVQYAPNKRQRPTDDLLRHFFHNVIDWENYVLQTNATFTGSLTVNLDAATDSIEVKGRDDANALRSVKTDVNGQLLVLDRGVSDIEVQHFSNVQATPAGVTETLTNAVSGLIINGEDFDIGISFDGGTSFFPLKTGGSFQWTGNNTSVVVKSLGGANAGFSGIYSARV